MTTLEIITSHVARLPEALRIELLHYALFLEQRFAKTGQTIEDPPEERQHLLAESLEAATRLNPFPGDFRSGDMAARNSPGSPTTGPGR